MGIYLDNSATTRPYPEVVQKVTDVMKNTYGNPSSLHRMGIAAEKEVKAAKERIAATLRVTPGEIFFTSGGTEANNLAILGTAMANRGKHIISTPLEHPATMNTLNYLSEHGYRIDFIPVDNRGVLRLAEFEDMLSDDTVLVTAMIVNNEIGTLEPIEKLAKIIKQRGLGTYLHVDAVQGYCKVPFTAASLGADMITLSSHKIHGPKGMGALYIKKGTKIAPTVYGGGQQNGIRPGTENVPGIAGFGLAAEICHRQMTSSLPRMAALRERLMLGIEERVSNIIVNTPEIAAPHILNISFSGVKSEVLLHSLEAENIYVSSGSACSSHKKEPSYVLTSIGLNRKMIDGSIRFSLSEFTTEQEIDEVVETVARVVKQLRKLNIG